MLVRAGVDDDFPAMASVFRRASLTNEGDRNLLFAHPELTELDPPGADDIVLVAEVPNHRVRAVCKRCSRPTATTPPVCDPCRDAADVAREAAGRGAHAPGDHLPQARKGKKWS